MATHISVDVLCIGHASYDLTFAVAHHPASDEKMFADELIGCGGGPAANAAVIVAKLNYRAAFSGYLGNDSHGSSHLQELNDFAVDTTLIRRGSSPTPLSAILVKPDGQRALINYKGDTRALPGDAIDYSAAQAKVLLADGHEPQLTRAALRQPQLAAIPKLLDAGSLNDGTRALLNEMDYLVCSEKFALQYAGDEQVALQRLSERAPNVVITLGERGLIWRRGQLAGKLPAPPISAIDTTGAGDAFHGAFAAGLAAELDWIELLKYASAAGGFCCSQMGARTGLPDRAQVNALLEQWQF